MHAIESGDCALCSLVQASRRGEMTGNFASPSMPGSAWNLNLRQDRSAAVPEHFLLKIVADKWPSEGHGRHTITFPFGPSGLDALRRFKPLVCLARCRAMHLALRTKFNRRMRHLFATVS